MKKWYSFLFIILLSISAHAQDNNAKDKE